MVHKKDPNQAQKKQTSPKLSSQAKSANAGKIPAPSAEQHLPSSLPEIIAPSTSKLLLAALGQDMVSQGLAASPGLLAPSQPPRRLLAAISEVGFAFRGEQAGSGMKRSLWLKAAGGFAKQRLLLKDLNISCGA